VDKVEEQEGEDDYDEKDAKRQCKEPYQEADGVDHYSAIQYASQ
jgi:hypothetical protein